VVREMNRRIREAMGKTEREREGRRRKDREWWDEECRKKKKEMRRTLRRWRRGKEQGTKYRKERQKYRSTENCARGKERERTRKIVEARGGREGK